MHSFRTFVGLLDWSFCFFMDLKELSTPTLEGLCPYGPERTTMTAPQRSRWNQKQLDRIRRFIRKRLDILTYTARADKEEIESKVMEKIEETIAGIPDYDVEHGGGTPLESAADSLALQVLLEQDFRREMGREACGPRAMPLFKQPFHRVENE